MLNYSTYVAPSKPAVSDDLPPGELRRMWSPTAATLIYGKRDAVLVDPLMTAAEGEDLVGWIAATGKNLTTIFVTHGTATTSSAPRRCSTASPTRRWWRHPRWSRG